MLDSADANASLVYRFGRFEVDEARYSFKINGSAVPLTGKPWQLLLLLLKRSPSAVNRREILQLLWAGRVVTDGVLAQAVSRLRIALSDQEQTLVHTVHGTGFALRGPVTVVQREVAFDPRDEVVISRATRLPGHQVWQLQEPMTIGGRSAVWLAEHRVTHERHVFKFAVDTASLASLKRELAVSRLLEEVEIASGCVPVLDWNLTTAPYYLELPHIEGSTLDEWCLAAAPTLPEQLELLASIADTLAGIHRAGVVHGDLKPRNILMQIHPEGGASALLADFGSAAVQDLERLRTLSVSMPTASGAPGSGGTLLYIAPEVLAGAPPSPASDVYALGVILYQMLVGRFDQPIGAGWELAIASEVLRADIRDFCNIDLALRQSDAKQLALRLRTVAQREEQMRQANTVQTQLEQYQALSARRRLYGWVALLFVTMSLIASIGWYGSFKNKQAAQLAKSETETLMHYFLDKVFFRADPVQGGSRSMTVVEALSNIEESVNADLKEQPTIRAAVLEQLVMTYTALNELERSTRISKNALQDSSLALSEASRDQFMLTQAENLRVSGRNVEAVPIFVSLLNSPSISKSPQDRAIILLNLSSTQIYLGRYLKANTLAAQAAAVRGLPRELEANIQNGVDQALGMSFGYLGNLEEAAAHFAKIAQRSAQDPSLDPSMLAKRCQAWLMIWHGKFDQAVTLQRQALSGIQNNMPGTLAEIAAKVTLVEFLLQVKQPSEAKQILNVLDKTPRRHNFDLLLSGRKLVFLAMANLQESSWDNAEHALQLAEPLIIEGDSRESETYARWLDARAELLSQTNNSVEARSLQERSNLLRQRLRK